MGKLDSAAAYVGDELVRLLAGYPAEHGAPVAELPEHLRNPDLLTVAEDDGLIELCRRQHCYVGPGAAGASRYNGPGPARELRIEHGWKALRWIPESRGPMDRFLATETERDERIRAHVRLTAAGRARAARLDLQAPVEAGPADTEDSPNDQADHGKGLAAVGWVTGIGGVAAYYGVKDPGARERLRAVVARWRKDHPDDCRKDENPKASGTYLYRVEALRPSVDDLKRREAKRVQGGRKRPSPVRPPRRPA